MMTDEINKILHARVDIPTTTTVVAIMINNRMHLTRPIMLVINGNGMKIMQMMRKWVIGQKRILDSEKTDPLKREELE